MIVIRSGGGLFFWHTAHWHTMRMRMYDTPRLFIHEYTINIVDMYPKMYMESRRLDFLM